MKYTILKGGLIAATFIILPEAWSASLFVDQNIPSNCSGTYSVSARKCSGKDGNAYRTIQQAVKASKPGDSILIRNGTYSEAVLFNSTKKGTATAPISLGNYGNEIVIIDGKKQLNPLVIDSTQYIKVKGIKVTRSKGYGIKVRNSHYVTIDQAEASYSQWGGIVFESGGHHTLKNSKIYRSNQTFNGKGGSSYHEAVTMDRVDTFEISYCEVYENWKEGIDAKYNSRNGSIHHNHVHHNNWVNVYVDAGHAIEIHSNTIHNAGNASSYSVKYSKPGIGLAVESTSNYQKDNLYDVKIYNNVIYNNNSGGVEIWAQSGAVGWANINNIKILNNTLHSNGNGINSWSGANVFGSGNEIKNNIFWANIRSGNSKKEIADSAGGISSKFLITNNLFQKGRPSSTFGKNFIVTDDVKFIDISKQNYRIKAESPAMDSGVLATTVLNKDFDGMPRPFSKSFDIGAYEFHRVLASPTIKVISACTSSECAGM